MAAPPDPGRERGIFETALELASAPERAAFLKGACGDDSALRQRIEVRLAVHSSALLFRLEDGTVESPATVIEETKPAEGAGSVIGRYKLLEKLGEGGFGSVWAAEQKEPVRRRVALKIIKLGMDTQQVVARFEAERQALALMDHPNIAKVLDAGATETGRPYFVMELVKGIAITQFCEQEKLSTKSRLDLFIKVCNAIQHAHQKGIIHRDIKPSNIMVTLHDGVPVPKVIDFGIAKATQQSRTELTIYTQQNQFIGTPAYMSPEQAEMSGLDIDTRSDIYALGVVLYELLTGKTPFDAKELLQSGIDKMRKIIREQEPARPSTRLSQTLEADAIKSVESTNPKSEETRASSRRLLQELRGDLDWIVMKALEKDRTRRYDTSNALAADIARHLNNEPVIARPPSAGYRFQKAYRRNKLAFATAGLVAGALVLGVVASTWQAARAREAEQLATKARQDAEAISSFLTDMFESSRPGEKQGGREVKVAEILDRAAEKLKTDLTAQPGQRATLQATLGGTYRALGLPREAIPLQEQVRDFHIATSGIKSPESLKAMGNLAISYSDVGRWEDALKLSEGVLPISREVLGPEHPGTLQAMHALAICYFRAGRPDAALKLEKELLALRQKVLGSENPETLKAMSALAVFYLSAGQLEEALKLLEEMLPLSRKTNGPEHPETLRAMANLAGFYHGAGRLDDALQLQSEMLAVSRKVNGPEHPDTHKAMANLASFYREAGRLDDALKLQAEVLTLSRKVNGLEDPETLGAMAELASLYFNSGRLNEALKLREEVLPLSRKVNGPEHSDTLEAMTQLAISWQAADRVSEAIALEEKALKTLRTQSPESPEMMIQALENLATCYAKSNRKEEAAVLRKEIAELKAKSAQSDESRSP